MTVAAVLADALVMFRTGPGWFAITGWGVGLILVGLMVIGDWGFHVKFKDRDKR